MNATRVMMGATEFDEADFDLENVKKGKGAWAHFARHLQSDEYECCNQFTQHIKPLNI